MHQVQVLLTERQVRRLLKGENVQLSHPQLMTEQHPLVLHHENVKKIHRARKSGKGVRLALSHPEIMASGEGLLDWFKNIGQFYQDHLKPVVGPIVKQSVSALKDFGVNALKTAVPILAPEIDSLNQRYGQQAVDALGRVTHSYGLKMKKKRGTQGGNVSLSDNYSNFIAPRHPAAQPHLPLNDPGSADHGAMSYSYGYGAAAMGAKGSKGAKGIRKERRKKGGSFRIAS